MKFIHFSDIHVSELLKLKSNELSQISCEIKKIINQPTEETFVIISGDIVDKGTVADYDRALEFFNNINEKKNLIFIAAPGNHDIVRERNNPFEAFNSFSGKLRGRYEADLSNTKSFFSITHRNYQFVILNSAYHKDIAFGQIDPNSFSKIKTLLDPNKIKIAVFHHPIISTKDEYKSVIRNSYELLQFLCTNNFMYAFHGHCHFHTSMIAGSVPLRIIGVSSLFQSSPAKNQFNVLCLKDKDLIEAKRYFFLQDKVVDGLWGSFEPTDFQHI